MIWKEVVVTEEAISHPDEKRDWKDGEKVECGMGCLELRILPNGRREVVRQSARGKEKYSFLVGRPGRYRFGPIFAHRVKEVAEERDPVLRVMREAALPVSALCRHDGSGGSIEKKMLPNRVPSCLSDGQVDDRDGAFGIIEGTYALEIQTFTTGECRSYIGKVHTFADADPTVLASAISDALKPITVPAAPVAVEKPEKATHKMRKLEA